MGPSPAGITNDGRNDAPRFDQLVTHATITERPGSSETTSSNLSGTFSASDPDADSLLSYTAATVNNNPATSSNTTNSQNNANNNTTTVGSYGSISLNASTGDYTYTPLLATIEALNDGDTTLDLFRITASDGIESATTELSVSITGADENPIPEPTPQPNPEPTPAPTPELTPEPLPPQEPIELDCLVSRLIKNSGLNISGSRCNDIIKCRSKDDALIGRSGDDILKGKSGNDLLKGGQDFDLLLGGQGDDIVKGGRGADLIHLSSGQDQILDFKPQRGDRLNSKNKFSFAATELDGHLILTDINNNTQITLLNISLKTMLAVQPELFS